MKHDINKNFKGKDKCQLLFIQTAGSVHCGIADAHSIEKMCFNATRKPNDHLVSPIKTWVLPQAKLKTYFKNFPFTFTDYTAGKVQVYPVGINFYLWNNSVITGYVCIVNNGTVISNASMKITAIYVNQSDVLSETIMVRPDGKQHCFKKWGNGYHVTLSAYYTIEVDIPANYTYNWELRVLKAFVNVSDYGQPRYVSAGNKTCYDLINNVSRYIGICKAPSYLHRSPSPHLDAESLHINVCNIPKVVENSNLYTYYIVMGVTAAISVVLLYTICLFFCCITYKCCRQRNNPYRQL